MKIAATYVIGNIFLHFFTMFCNIILASRLESSFLQMQIHNV